MFFLYSSIWFLFLVTVERRKRMQKNLKKKAAELGDKAQEFIHRPELQDAISKGKDLLEKGKDKLEDFVEDKTDGKGIFGFGEKEEAKK